MISSAPALLAHGGGSGSSPWAFVAHPDVWLLMAGLLAGYVAICRAFPATRRQQGIFAVGWVLLWLASDWPMHDISERYLLSVHMVQHLIFTLVVPPLFLLGLPTGFIRRVLIAPPRVRAVAARLTKPLPAALLFNLMTVLTHWPVMVDASLRTPLLHVAVHTVMMVTAAIMWMPVLNRQPELPALSYPGRMVYLFLQSVIPTVPASFLTFATGPVYHFYADAPRPFDISLLSDQQTAGAVMKLMGGSILWGVIIVLFFRWYRTHEQGGGDVLTWADVERELERVPPVR